MPRGIMKGENVLPSFLTPLALQGQWKAKLLKRCEVRCLNGKSLQDRIVFLFRRLLRKYNID